MDLWGRCGMRGRIRRAKKWKRGDEGTRGSGVGLSHLPTTFPGIRSLLSRSFLLFHHVGWGQASVPATAATDWPATATQAQYDRGKFHYFSSALRSRSGGMEEGKSYYFYCALCGRINLRWVMLACTRLLPLAIQANMYLHTVDIYISLLCRIQRVSSRDYSETGIQYTIYVYYIAYLNIECKCLI